MLFNRDDKGSSELYRITGYFDANTPWEAIESEIDDATRVVRGLVGADVVDKAEADYALGNEEGIVSAVRTPVAILAVSRYSRGNLVSHEGSGSKVKVDNNERMPWEWMIDRDEREQQDRWYRALDSLYAFLEQNEIVEWKVSDAYKRYRRSIIRSIPELEAIYPVDGSYYVFFLLQNLVIECQPKIRKTIGEDNWVAISKGDDVAGKDMDLLILCQRWAALSALVNAVRRWSIEVFPLQIARRFCPSYQGGRSRGAASKEEMNSYIDALEMQIDEVRSELAELLAGANTWENFDVMPQNDPSNKFFTAQ